jgi:ABC-type branched-subunit amino acid transport system substrate-binding protein
VVRARFTLAAALVALAGISGCGGGSDEKPAQGPRPFVLLFVGDLSGPTKVYGEAQLAGVKAAAGYLNATAGGIGGHKVQVSTLDNGGQAPAAVNLLVRRLAQGPRPDAVYAGAESVTTAALLPVLARNKLYGFAQTDGNGLLASGAHAKFPTQFNSGNSFPAIAQAAVDWFKRHNVTKIGVLQENLAYPIGEMKYLAEALDAAGIAYTVATFPATATDNVPQLNKLRSANVQAVYAQALGPAVGFTLKARQKLGWDVPILGDVAFGANNLPKLVPASALKGVEFITPFSVPDTSQSNGLDMLEKHMKAARVTTPEGATFSSVSEAWDGVIMTAVAARQAKSIAPDAISSALENLRVTTDPGYASQAEMGFTPDNHTNVRLKPSDMPIVTPGRIVNGRLHSERY